MDTPDDPDLRLARHAGARHGVVSRRELRELGLSDTQIAHRIACGRLHRRYLGVYAVGHTALTREGRWLAAVLTCGPRAVLSHGDAAAHWGLMPARGARIDVTIASRNGRDLPQDIRPHRVGALPPEERTERDAIPVTTPARTLLDLAATTRRRRLEDLIAQADRLELFDLREVRRVLEAHPRRPGAPTLAALLDDLRGEGPADTRSPAEVALLQLCDDFGLPAPVANVPFGIYTVDFHWPETTLIVEADGYQFHRMPSQFEADRERDQTLTLAGYTVARFTKRQLERQGPQSATRLRALLQRCARP